MPINIENLKHAVENENVSLLLEEFQRSKIELGERSFLEGVLKADEYRTYLGGATIWEYLMLKVGGWSAQNRDIFFSSLEGGAYLDLYFDYLTDVEKHQIVRKDKDNDVKQIDFPRILQSLYDLLTEAGPLRTKVFEYIYKFLKTYENQIYMYSVWNHWPKLGQMNCNDCSFLIFEYLSYLVEKPSSISIVWMFEALLENISKEKLPIIINMSIDDQTLLQIPDYSNIQRMIQLLYLRERDCFARAIRRKMGNHPQEEFIRLVEFYERCETWIQTDEPADQIREMFRQLGQNLPISLIYYTRVYPEVVFYFYASRKLDADSIKAMKQVYLYLIKGSEPHLMSRAILAKRIETELYGCQGVLAGPIEKEKEAEATESDSNEDDSIPLFFYQHPFDDEVKQTANEILFEQAKGRNKTAIRFVLQQLENEASQLDLHQKMNVYLSYVLTEKILRPEDVQTKFDELLSSIFKGGGDISSGIEAVIASLRTYLAIHPIENPLDLQCLFQLFESFSKKPEGCCFKIRLVLLMLSELKKFIEKEQNIQVKTVVKDKCLEYAYDLLSEAYAAFLKLVRSENKNEEMIELLHGTLDSLTDDKNDLAELLKEKPKEEGLFRFFPSFSCINKLIALKNKFKEFGTFDDQDKVAENAYDSDSSEGSFDSVSL